MSSDFCLCSKDQDGQCEPCKGALGLFFNGLVELQNLYLEQIDRLKELHDPHAVCDGCRAMYADQVMTRFFGTVLEKIPKRDLAFQMYQFSASVSKGFGAKATPHLDRVWTEVCRSNGWDPQGL